MKHIFIDSDIFVRDLRYPNDNRTPQNQKFLSKIKKNRRGATSIFNVLEVAGIMSYNLNPEQLFTLYADFTNHYGIKVLFPADAAGNLMYDITAIFMQIQKRQNLGDAQIASVVEKFSDKIDSFVSWNAPHFRDKISIRVLTPEEYL